jgi:predicted  nucleic acid-binding Zn-ribbon protein
MTGLTDAKALDLIHALDETDGQIETLNDSKRDLLKDAREQMEALGMSKGDIGVAIGAVKDAVKKIRKRRARPEAADQADEQNALADHYVELASRSAPRTSAPACDIDWSAVKSLRNTNSEAA